jgi:hypothetical protein
MATPPDCTFPVADLSGTFACGLFAGCWLDANGVGCVGAVLAGAGVVVAGFACA